MADTKDKMLSHRRFFWLDVGSQSLMETFFKEVEKKLPAVESRKIVRIGGQHVDFVALKARKGGGYFVHITAETPGEAASIVPNALPGQLEVQVEALSPPSGKEFMDGDIFLFIRENEMCICATGFTDAMLRDSIKDLFRKAALKESATHFDLQKQASIDAMSLINREGVKEIELQASCYEATANLARRQSQTAGLLGAISKQMRLLLKSEHDVTNDSLRVKLTIVKDKRFRKHLALGEKRIDSLAANVIENAESDDSFLIVTNKNNKIRPEQLHVQKITQITANAKSLDRQSAWDKLYEFYSELIENQVIEL